LTNFSLTSKRLYTEAINRSFITAGI